MLGLSAIVFGITFWLIVEDHKKRKIEKRWERQRWEDFYRRFPAAKRLSKHRP